MPTSELHTRITTCLLVTKQLLCLLFCSSFWRVYCNGAVVRALHCKPSGNDSLFNSSWRPMLYVIHFTVPRHLFYRQKMGQVLKKWPRIYQLLHLCQLVQGRTSTLPFQWRRVTTLLVSLPLPHGQLFTTPPHPYLPPGSTMAMASQCIYRPLQVICCLLFVRACLLYSVLKRLYEFESNSYLHWWKLVPLTMWARCDQHWS